MSYPSTRPLYPNHHSVPFKDLCQGRNIIRFYVWNIDEEARQVGETNQEDVGEIHAWNYEGLDEEIISERMNLRRKNCLDLMLIMYFSFEH